jgi:4-amino-4-deoxy-L-arabinose transferase-like glycosyltransferase
MSETYSGYSQRLRERAALGRRAFTLEWLLARLRVHHLALAAILALSAVLGTYRLSHNGYANTFYSAGVASMLRSLHNFLYASFDPGGLITIDKPPLGVWVQVGSAKLFGLSPLSLLLPEALLATLTVWVLYRMVASRLGVGAGLAGALALAVFPSFVAVSRDNGVDPLLIFLMVCACGTALPAVETGRWRWLIACAALVGLAFNTKTLAAYLVIPGIALAYLLCAPRSLPSRAAQLALAGVLMGTVSFAWVAFVELTPAHSRPFVGSSTDNTELGLTFDYNGFGRVQGEIGGPGRIPVAAGAVVLAPHRRTVVLRGTRTGRSRPGAASAPSTAELLPKPRPHASAMLPNGRYRNPIAFGERPGPWRLFGKGLGDQGAWMLPFALAGLLALALSLLGGGGAVSRRRDPRLAVALVLGGWFVCEVLVLSFSKGIVHPYYVSALAPPAAAMVGVGASLFTRFARGRDWRVVLLACAIATTVAVQLLLLHQQRYMQWFELPLVALSVGGLVLMSIRRLAGTGMALALLSLSVAPAAFASTSWLAPVYGTFPAAGTHEASGNGLYGLNRKNEALDHALIAYVRTHRPARRWAVLADASPTAAPLILMGLDAGALAGYSGTDPALDGPRLARLVARGEARYVVLGGAYATRGGNYATRAVLTSCALVPAPAWHGHRPSPHTLVLFDCAGHERALAGPPRYRNP